jgi:uncharacterized protein YkwD
MGGVRASAWLSLGIFSLADARAAGTPIAWASETTSPRPSPVGAGLPTSCAEGDRALAEVAARVAHHEIAAADSDAIAYALRAAGEPHVWPRAMTLEGRTLEPSDARARIGRWLSGMRRRGVLRCGAASLTEGGQTTIAVVAVDAQADMMSVPIQVRPASWIDVDAPLLVSAHAAKLVALGPSGPPRVVPTSIAAGRVRARANVDRAGSWLFQVVIDGDGGPRPVLEALVFSGVTPPATRAVESAPGETAPPFSNPANALAEMVARARESEGRAPLAPSERLDRVARAHADRMMRARELAHDVGDGDVRERLADAGFDPTEVGENIAHAANVALAHRVLWASPSHRDNLLGPRFTRLGVGVIPDPDGTVWVTEVFAR